MAKVKVKIAADNREVLKRMVEENAAVALEAVGLAVEAHAKVNCPVDTGNLRNSITHTVDENTAYIGTNVEYAPYVHEGTDHMPPRRFLKNALMDNLEEYKEILTEYLIRG